MRVLPLALAFVAAAAAASRAVPAPDPAEAVREALRSSWEMRGAETDSLEIVHVPALRGDVAALVRAVWPDGPLAPGPRAIPVERVENGRVTARALANVVLHREIPVWVACRTVARGDTVRAGDLRRETRLWNREPVRALAGGIPRRGAVARRELAANAWVRESDVRPCPDAETGESILLLARAAGAVVSIPGIVRRSGFLGDTLLVLNPLTGSIVRARLVEPGRAELVTARERAERNRS